MNLLNINPFDTLLGSTIIFGIIQGCTMDYVQMSQLCTVLAGKVEFFRTDD